MLERKFYAGSVVDQIQGGKESYTVTAASRYGGLGVLYISKLSFQFCAQFVFSIFLFNFISNAYFLIFSSILCANKTPRLSSNQREKR